MLQQRKACKLRADLPTTVAVVPRRVRIPFAFVLKSFQSFSSSNQEADTRVSFSRLFASSIYICCWGPVSSVHQLSSAYLCGPNTGGCSPIGLPPCVDNKTVMLPKPGNPFFFRYVAHLHPMTGQTSEKTRVRSRKLGKTLSFGRQDLKMGRTKSAHRNAMALAQQERQSTEQVPFFEKRREAKMR